MTMTSQDRTELAQYRAIFAAMTTLVERGGVIHLYGDSTTGRVGARVYQASGDESVSGATVRDAMAQAAQVVEL